MRHATSRRQLVEDSAGRDTSERLLDSNRLAQAYVTLVALDPSQDISRDIVRSRVGNGQAWLSFQHGPLFTDLRILLVIGSVILFAEDDVAEIGASAAVKSVFQTLANAQHCQQTREARVVNTHLSPSPEEDGREPEGLLIISD